LLLLFLSKNQNLSKFIYSPLTFGIDIDSICTSLNDLSRQKSVLEKEIHTIALTSQQFYHSMPDLRVFNENGDLSTGTNTYKMISLQSKHLSLLDLNSYRLVYSQTPTIINNKQKCSENKVVNNSDQTETPLQVSDDHLISTQFNALQHRHIRMSTCGSGVNFGRLSRLAILRSYVTRIGERFKEIVRTAFSSDTDDDDNISTNESKFDANSLKKKSNITGYGYNVSKTQLYSISEETLDSYDIIETDHIMETPQTIAEKMLQLNLNTNTK
jgi:hypothetical protein